MVEKVIITLTTVPERLEYDHPKGIKSVVYSLLNLKYRNYEIHFNIPMINNRTKKEYIIPEWLKEISETKECNLKIFRTKDYGPITKIYPTVQRVKDPNQLIIIVDDDIVYETTLIEEHLKLRAINDNVVWGYRGINFVDLEKFMNLELESITMVNETTSVDILYNLMSTSYRRRFFETDFNVEFCSKGWNDDLLVSAYMAKKGIGRLIPPTEYNYLYKYFNSRINNAYPVSKFSKVINTDIGCNMIRNEGIPHMDDDLCEHFTIGKNIKR